MKIGFLVASAILCAAPAHAVATCKASKEAYSQLETGMSYERAVEIIGCEGEEMSSSEIAGFKTIMLMWEGNSFASSMNAMFQNNELVSKAQMGLK